MINIIKDKDPIWETEQYDVILVGTSIYNMLTNGFQSKIRYKYPDIVLYNNMTPYGNKVKLGTRLTWYDNKPVISLMYIANYPNSRRVFVDYDALEKCLATADAEFKGKRVMTTLIGCTPFDGNGERERVMAILDATVQGMKLDVYDYEQLDKWKERGIKLKELKALDKEEYKSVLKVKYGAEYLKQFYLA